MDIVVGRKKESELRRAPRALEAHKRFAAARTPPPVSTKILLSNWKIAFQPPPSDSVPRIPNIEELELTRYWFGFGQLSGHPSPPCLPLTTSTSRLSRP
jgi:hypothetical protein